jgi:hypothetical protein
MDHLNIYAETFSNTVIFALKYRAEIIAKCVENKPQIAFRIYGSEEKIIIWVNMSNSNGAQVVDTICEPLIIFHISRNLSCKPELCGISQQIPGSFPHITYIIPPCFINNVIELFNNNFNRYPFTALTIHSNIRGLSMNVAERLVLKNPLATIRRSHRH